MKLSPNLIKATAVGALGGLLFGFDTAVIAGTTHSLTLGYGLSPSQLGLTVSIALIGTVVSAISAFFNRPIFSASPTSGRSAAATVETCQKQIKMRQRISLHTRL